MGRGDNPNSRANLIVNSERTPKERKEQAQKAGIKSGEARREQKQIRERIFERMTDDDLTIIVDNLIDRAKTSTRDFEMLRDTLGQKPKQTIDVDRPPMDFVITFGDDE